MHRLRTEMRLSLYQTLCPDICVHDEVDQFLKSPLECYNSDICNMFLAARGKTFKVNIKVLQSIVTNVGSPIPQINKKDTIKHVTLQGACLHMLMLSFQNTLLHHKDCQMRYTFFQFCYFYGYLSFKMFLVNQ